MDDGLVYCDAEESLPEDAGHGNHYVYSPRPPGVKNPLIKKHEFRKYLRACGIFCIWSYIPLPKHRCCRPHKDSHKWMRIPKKKTKFDAVTEEVAFGMEAVYTISFLMVFVYHSLSIVALSGFVAWWLHHHPGDLQNASIPPMAFLAIVASFWALPGRGNNS
jgi:hypothetical protein